MSEMIKCDDVCHHCHLYMVSKKMVKWELFAIALGLHEADIEVIKRNHLNDYDLQKYQMLCEWKKLNGENATYKALADFFTKNEHVDLAESLLDIIIKEPVSSISVVVKKFKHYLKLKYKKGINFEQWPPVPPLDKYINLALINQQSVKLNKIDDSYTKSTIHHCPDDVLREKVPINLKDIFKFEEKEENKCTLIEGGPGLGKTTLSFKICKDWAAGDLLQDYDAVILLQLRLPKLQKAEKVIDLLLAVDDDDDDFIKNVWKEMRDNHGEKVCFIIEGFDELPPDLQVDSIFTQISEKLPHAMIIYTSRPVAVSHLLRLINKRKRIEITGFKQEQVQEFIETTRDHLNKAEVGYKDTGKSNLMGIIKKNTFVKRLSYIPIYLTIITYLFDTSKSLPSTRTKLFDLLVQNIVLRYLIEKTRSRSAYLMSLDDISSEESKHFSNICHLAFQGLKNNKIIFNTSHLRDYGIPEDINGLGLLQITPTLCNHGRIRSLNFMHLNFQEFCAAFYISKLTEYEQYKIFMQHQDDPHFQICWQFFAGLTKLKCQQILTSMIPKSDLHSSLYKYNLIQLLLCLYEAGSPDLCKQVIKFMNSSIDLSEYDMDQLSCFALSYFIKNCAPGSIKSLKLKWCGIKDIGLQCICKALISNYKSCVDVRSHSVSLDFSYNEITEQGAHHIAELISSPCVIECLNCSGNYQLGDNGVKAIANSLLKKSVKILELGKIGFGLKGMQALSKVLCSDSNLHTVDISKNNLDFRMLNCLSESLASNNTLTTLLLKWCKLGADEARVLSNIIKSNRTLNSLDLGYNELGAGGIASIISAVKENQSLQTVNLNVNGITCKDACYVADLISTNLHHLSSLHIGGNFGKQGLAAVCNAAKKNTSLTTLDLTPNSMSVASKPLGCLVNVFNNIHIKSLHIVPPHDCSVLSEAIASNTTLEELKLCVKVTRGFTTLTKVIANNRTITKLEFLFTKLKTQWLKAISNMLQIKTNFVSLIINGEVYPEDCLQLCDTLPKCSSLQFFSFTAYQKMIPATALQFLSCLYALNSLERITLKINSHLTQDEKIPDQESSGAAQQKLIPKQNVLIFRQIECLISSINERHCSVGSPELRLFIQEN